MSLPDTMQAARLLSNELKYTFQTLPLPVPQAGEILVQIVAAGLCHTDLVMPLTNGGPVPITGSHEPAGIVAALGPGVDPGTFPLGQRIMAVNTARACKECGNCKRYDERWCPKAAMIGLRFMDGAFADYCIVDARYAAVIPDGMSFEQAATMSCAGVTIYSAIKRAGLKRGDVLGISGLGALGSLGVELAKCLGVIVVGIDVKESSLKAIAASPYPADLLINPLEIDAAEAVQQIQALRPEGYDYGLGVDALIMLNSAPSAVPYAITLIRPHGLIIYTSGPPVVQMGVLDFIWKDITAIGTQNGTAKDMLEMANVCVERGIKSVIRPYAFEQGAMNRMLEDVQAPGWSGKAVVKVRADLWG